MKYQVYLALIAGSSAFKLRQHAGVRFTDNEIFHGLSDVIGMSEASNVVHADDFKDETPPTSLADNKGVPVHVNPTVATNTEADTSLGLKMRVGPDDVSVVKNKVISNQDKLASHIQEMNSLVGPEETDRIVSSPDYETQSERNDNVSH